MKVEAVVERLGWRAVEVVAVCSAWIVAFRLNDWLFPFLEASEWASFMFLPAAVRLGAVLLLGWPAALGLWIGALWTTPDSQPTLSWLSVGLATVSAAGPVIAVCIWSRVVPVAEDLRRIRAIDLVSMTFLCALLNAAGSTCLVYWARETAFSLSETAAMFTGDVVGTLTCFYLLGGLVRVFRRA